MLNEQEQKILDNAPEWAEYHMMHNELQTGYAIKVDGRYFDNNSNSANPYGTEFVFGAWLIASLADLRKKQGKTVVDAVNCCFPVESMVDDGWFINNLFEIFFNEKYVCTVEQLEQCVDDLAKYGNKPPTIDSLHVYRQYECAQKKLDNHAVVKPRMKVEYVNVCEANCCVWDLKGMLEREILYVLGGDGKYLLCSNNAPMYMLVCFDEGRVYRKVETEITWQDEAMSLFGRSNSLVEDDTLYELITNSDDPEESKQFIEMCHLVSSMNK